MAKKYLSSGELLWIVSVLSAYIFPELLKVVDPESVDAKRLKELDRVLRYLCVTVLPEVPEQEIKNYEEYKKAHVGF